MLSDATPSQRFCWTVVILLTLANTLSFIDRMLLSMLVEPVKASLDLSDTQIGMLHGMPFALFYATVGIWLGRLADRTHRPRLIAIGMAIWSAATMSCAFATGFAGLFGSRILVAIGEATLAPAAYALIADLFAARSLGRALSVYQIGLYVGVGLALILGGVIAGGEYISTPGTDPWRTAFLIAGFPGLLLAAALFFVPDARPVSRMAHQSKTTRRPDFMAYMRRHLPVYAVIYGSFALVGVAVYATNAWMPTILVRNHGLGLETAGLSLGVIFLAATPIGVLAAGYLADQRTKSGRPAKLVSEAAIGIALLGPAVLLFATTSSTTLAIAMAIPVAILLSFPFGYDAYLLQRVTPPQFRSSVSAVHLFIFTVIGYSLGPLLVGLLTDQIFGNETSVGLALAAILILTAPAAGLGLFLGRKHLSHALQSEAAAHDAGPESAENAHMSVPTRMPLTRQ